MRTRPALLIARTETRRRLRVVAGDRTKLLLTVGIALLVLGPITLLGALGLREAGEAAAAGTLDGAAGVATVELVGGAAAMGWLGLTIMATIRTVTAVGDVDHPACVLLATSSRNAVAGLIGSELLLFACWVAPAATVLAGAFAVGAGSAVPLVVAFVLLGVLLATAIPVGFLLGVWIRHLLTVYEPVARYRTPLLVAVGVAYFGAIAAGWFDAITAVLFETLRGSPLGWPGHLLLMGLPGLSPSTGALVGTVVGAPIVAGIAFAAAVASAEHHWFADPARTDDDRRTVESSDRLATLLARGVDRPTRTVAVTAVRRTKRAPVRLLYVGYPLFGGFVFLQDVVQTGTFTRTAAVFCCLYVVWGAGALFTLNPLGDCGRALPGVLTTPIGGRQAIGGLVVAGAVVAAPVSLVVASVAGLASPLSTESTATLVAGTVVGAVAAPALATGVGALFPRFGSVRVTGNREAVMPSKTAFVAYTLALALPIGAAATLYADAGPELVAAMASFLLSLPPGLSATVPAGAVEIVAWIVVVLGAAGPVASAGYAARRFERFTLE